MSISGQKIAKYFAWSLEDYASRNKHWVLYRWCLRLSKWVN